MTKTTNYARFISTGLILFFDDRHPPAFRYPELWAFYRVPPGTDPAEFRGRVIGVTPAGDEPDVESEAS